MKSRIYIPIFFLLINVAVGQGLGNNWLLGYWRWPNLIPPATSAKASVNFFGGTPLVSPLITKMIFNHTQGNISNASGNLLMSSNGIFIANATGDTMLNGGGINPDPYLVSNFSITGLKISHGNIFLPFPGDSSKYILLHQSILDSPICCNSTLYYSVIDISQDGGLGAVIQKNILLPLPRLSGGIAACKHANGRDWWVILEQDTSNVIWKLLISPQGVDSISSQSFPNNITFFGSESQACFSPDGKKFAFTTLRGLNMPQWTNIIRYFNFNRCSGNLSELTSIPIPDTLICRGLCFSPNSKYLYACSNKVIYQLNTDTSNIAASIDTVAVYDGFQGGISNQFELLYRANNDKIYVSTYGGSLYLGCINAPDSAGVACNVQQHSLAITCYNTKSVPNHPNYFLGADAGSPCDTLLSTNQLKNNTRPKFAIAPNPANNEFSVFYENSEETYSFIEIANINGDLIERIPLQNNKTSIILNTENYQNGVYLVKLISTNSLTQVSKLVILK